MQKAIVDPTGAVVSTTFEPRSFVTTDGLHCGSGVVFSGAVLPGYLWLDLVDEPPPDTRFGHIGAPVVVVETDRVVRRREFTPFSLHDAKAQFIAQCKSTADSLLAASNWKVIRASEGVKPCDQATIDYRSAIRDASDAHEAAVLACNTVEELAALPPVAWPHP